MQKRIILIISSVLLVLCTFLTACTSTFNFDSCTGKEPGKGDEITEELTPADPIVDTAFSFEIENIDGAYYPTFIGIVTLDYYPDKVTVYCNEEETTLNPVKVDYVNGLYEFRFEQQIVYDRLEKGYYNATVYSYLRSTKTALSEMLTLYANEGYSAVHFIDYGTLETVVAMDKDSNYI